MMSLSSHRGRSGLGFLTNAETSEFTGKAHLFVHGTCPFFPLQQPLDVESPSFSPTSVLEVRIQAQLPTKLCPPPPSQWPTFHMGSALQGTVAFLTTAWPPAPVSLLPAIFMGSKFSDNIHSFLPPASLLCATYRVKCWSWKYK